MVALVQGSSVIRAMFEEGTRLGKIYGPENVIIIAGMNKIVTSVEEGIIRTRNVASPQNCIRLDKDTPCKVNGVCGNCLKDTICDQIVITRASRVPKRIKVILVGEDLGF